jgi:iron(III) transport system ATP-binding protein
MKAAGGPVVQVENLVKRFRRRDGETVNAIDGISLEVCPGELVVLLGPSGCGKTTLLRCIAGLEQPDAGTISINGRQVWADRGRVSIPVERRNLSMVFQSYALWPHMTVFDNVAFPLRNRKTPKQEVARRVTRALEKVGVANLASSYPSQISGGQQQRVALARALVSNDGVILFDEPLSNVDARVRDELRFELLEMQREIGFSALYVTHDQTEAMAMADRIAVLGDGRVRQLAAPADVYQRPASRDVANFVGTANEVPGTVTAVDLEGSVTADTPLGKVYATAAAPTLVAGDSVVLIWRPEQAHTIPTPPREDEANCWRGQVQASVYVGTHTEADIAFGELKQRVWNMAGALPHAGSDVWVTVPAGHILAFGL